MTQALEPRKKKPAGKSLPEQSISREVLIEKYAKGNESTVAEVRSRVARALAAPEAEAADRLDDAEDAEGAHGTRILRAGLATS